MEKTQKMTFMVYNKTTEGSALIYRFEAECGSHIYNLDDAVKSYLNENKLLGKNVSSTGIKKIYENDFYFDSMSHLGCVEHTVTRGNMQETVIGASYNDSDEVTWQNAVLFEGEENPSDVYIGYKAFIDGIVLRTGKKSSILFTQCKNELCFLKVTSTKFKCSNTAKDAKIFKSYKEVLKYLTSHEDVFRYVVSSYGYHFSLDYPQECSQKYAEVPEELTALLSSINGEEERDLFPEPPKAENITEGTLLNEAISRMKRLNLWDIKIREFEREGRVCKSECGGVIYDLEDDAYGMRAVEKVKEMGCLPYHVIKNEMKFGPEYDVLYVSKSPESWQYERPNRDGYISVASYIPEYDSFDFGNIVVSGNAGGLRRTA